MTKKEHEQLIGFAVSMQHHPTSDACVTAGRELEQKIDDMFHKKGPVGKVKKEQSSTYDDSVTKDQNRPSMDLRAWEKEN